MTGHLCHVRVGRRTTLPLQGKVQAIWQGDRTGESPLAKNRLRKATEVDANGDDSGYLNHGDKRWGRFRAQAIGRACGSLEMLTFVRLYMFSRRQLRMSATSWGIVANPDSPSFHWMPVWSY